MAGFKDAARETAQKCGTCLQAALGLHATTNDDILEDGSPVPSPEDFQVNWPRDYFNSTVRNSSREPLLQWQNSSTEHGTSPEHVSSAEQTTTSRVYQLCRTDHLYKPYHLSIADLLPRACLFFPGAPPPTADQQPRTPRSELQPSLLSFLRNSGLELFQRGQLSRSDQFSRSGHLCRARGVPRVRQFL